MKIKNGMEEEYKKYVEINDDPYSKAIVIYGESWADMMEASLDLHASDPLVFAALAKETSRKTDVSGLTGFMYGAAVSALAHFWEYGDRLRQWHNKEYGVEEEQAKGGTVNPAILTVS